MPNQTWAEKPTLGVQRGPLVTKIVRELAGSLFSYLASRTLNVFLIGASTKNPASNRLKIKHLLETGKYDRQLDVYLPEDLFEDLLTGDHRYDLLGLENLLADSVDVVVITLESMGAAAELGAFANHERLRDKLVVLNDRDFEHAKSFLTLGPIRYLASRSKSRVFHYDKSATGGQPFAKQIRRMVREVAAMSQVDKTPRNLILCQHFILACLYVFEGLTYGQMHWLLEATAPDGETFDYRPNLTASLHTLRKKACYLKRGATFLIDKQGVARITSTFAESPAGKGVRDSLDEMRANVLNFGLRRKRKQSELFGEAALVSRTVANRHGV